MLKLWLWRNKGGFRISRCWLAFGVDKAPLQVAEFAGFNLPDVMPARAWSHMARFD